MIDTSIADAEVLAPEELREIAKHAVTRRYPARAMIVAEGDRSDSLFIIVEGRARAFVGDDAGHFIRKPLKRIRLLTDNVRSLALMDAYGRVARLLLESAVTEGGVQVVREKLTQAEIANRVGCSREMVSRIFKSIEQEGHVTVEAERIVIHHKPPWHGGRDGTGRHDAAPRNPAAEAIADLRKARVDKEVPWTRDEGSC